MRGDPLIEASVVELAASIRAGDASPLDVVDAHIARIEAFEPTVNAFCVPLLEQARDEARAAGERLVANPRTAGPLPPFLGVPFTSKEHYGIEGLPHTAGLVSRTDVRATRTTTIVQRMRDAGFVLLGTTNVPEALMWFETYNRVYGRTVNPWDPDRLPGGSSGGEGAVIGYGGSPVGLGGDVGGSIRNPAFFCGVCGHKPTGGRVPQTGAWPGARGRHARYRVSGPLSRRVADLQAVMPIIAGPDGHDGSVDGPAWADEPVGPERTRVTWFEGLDIAPPTPDVSAGLERAIGALERRGYTVERWRPPGLEDVARMWFGAMGDAGGASFEENLADGDAVHLWSELARWPLRRSRHIGPVLATVLLERATRPLKRLRGDSEGARLALQKAIEDRLGPDGVLVLPAFHRTAPRHGLDAVRSTLGFLYCAFLNPLELPATSVPTGFGADGLPVGVQIAGSRNRDAVTLGVARHVEEALGGWSPPPVRAARR